MLVWNCGLKMNFVKPITREKAIAHTYIFLLQGEASVHQILEINHIKNLKNRKEIVFLRGVYIPCDVFREKPVFTDWYSQCLCCRCLHNVFSHPGTQRKGRMFTSNRTYQLWPKMVPHIDLQGFTTVLNSKQAAMHNNTLRRLNTRRNCGSQGQYRH